MLVIKRGLALSEYGFNVNQANLKICCCSKFDDAWGDFIVYEEEIESSVYQACIVSVDGDGWVEYMPIKFCPFCGTPIQYER